MHRCKQFCQLIAQHGGELCMTQTEIARQLEDINLDTAVWVTYAAVGSGFVISESPHPKAKKTYRLTAAGEEFVKR